MSMETSDDSDSSSDLEFLHENRKKLQNGESSEYKILDWIGVGRFSDVFTAERSGRVFAVKILKNMRKSEIMNELNVLMALKGREFTILLEDIVWNPTIYQLSYVFEHIEETEFCNLMQNISDFDCRLYFYKLLRSIKYAHSLGIIHRDIKPNNILFNQKTKDLRLIDWGLATFHAPGNIYSTHIGSRHYRAPELLLNYQKYDEKIDIWSFGVCLASMIFQSYPFFLGSDDSDMIAKIVSVTGGFDFQAFIERCNLEYPKNVPKSLFNVPKRNWSAFLNLSSPLASPEALSLLQKCICIDPAHRISAEEALNLPFFDAFRSIRAL